MAETVYGIYIIRHSSAEPSDAPEDVGIILEGVTVLRELRNVPFALSILLAFVYNLNLTLQKIILDAEYLFSEVIHFICCLSVKYCFTYCYYCFFKFGLYYKQY
uniref:Uncharacterized protein n=1 Tax=Amphiprion ocellaris TaxID=80972 RepID=A0A3Q1BZE8_AMPOC